MKLLVVDNGTSHLQALSALLASHEVKVVPWKKFSEKKIASIDAIILSGGHSLPVIDHDREYGNELNVIRRSTLPIIGICLGYELIAHAYGAVLRRLEAKEKGFVQLKVVRPHQILLGVAEANVYESHRWVVERVTKPLIGLVASKDGYEIIVHESKPIFGFQFHPEMFQDVTVGDEIMKNCLALIQEERLIG
ncbi:MAG: gamma-glutamyl-gamma-aminobutyrate hydrolase family protein [Patescibacteria group bacterium]